MSVLTPYVCDPDFTLWNGDCLEVLQGMPAGSVDCCVTSPPYWGLRDYGVDGQLGLEATPAEYVARMVAVFREVRRVLSDTGTCWVNLGDSYASGEVGRKDAPTKNVGLSVAQKPRAERRISQRTGLKPKDLIGIPWRVALALQDDGWYLRSDIIWSKPNPMPESVTDRPTKAHEYVFLLSKQPRYYFDADAVREAFEAIPQQRLTALKDQPLAAARRAAGVEQGNPQGGTHVSRFAVQDANLLCGCIENGCGSTWKIAGRNIRSVWEIATQPYAEAHFACFPEELARRCILAGCPEGGTVLDPFMGSGTTALVARKLGRKSVGIELNETYCEMAARRLGQQSLLAEGAS